MLKRKGDLALDVWTQAKRSRKTEILSVEDNLDVEKHTNSMVLGAKSGGGEDPTDRLQLQEGTGLDLITLTEKDGRNGGLGLDENCWTARQDTVQLRESALALCGLFKNWPDIFWVLLFT